MAKGGKPEQIVKRLKYTLECSICMETFTDPRILDCVHSFCFKCIRTHVGNSTVIKCPLCNRESPVPVNTGIEGLKSNFFIKRLIDDVMHKEENNKDSVPAVCGSCDLGNLAKSHCDDCDCELCEHCIQQHRQLKIFKLHKFTLCPTDEGIKAQKEAKVNREITDIQNNIAENISGLQAKILQVQSKVKAVINERDATLSQVKEAYQRFVKEIDIYVQGLTTRIKESADKLLGDLPSQLKAYETQLTTYQDLEKQQKCMHDLNLHEKVKLCKELDKQIKKHKDRPSLALHLHHPFAHLPRLELVPENTGLEMAPLLEQAVGFLTPIKSRLARTVDIHVKDMSNSMKDYAVECANQALDKYGMYQSTGETLGNIAEHIAHRYEKRYNRGDWDCYVAKADIGCLMYWDKFLHLSIDGYNIILTQPLPY